MWDGLWQLVESNIKEKQGGIMDPLTEVFQTAAGTVPGTDHVLVGKNNHDALARMYLSGDSSCPEIIVAVVADGCGAGKHSEVGSKVGVQFVLQAMRQNLYLLFANQNSEAGSLPERFPSVDLFLARVKADTLFRLSRLIDGMASGLSGSRKKVIGDYFLFTIIGVLVTPEVSLTFSLGDGLIIVNGEVTQIGPFPDNKPPYLAYGITDVDSTQDPALLDFRVHRIMPTDQVETVLLGTDGAIDLMNASERKMPGKETLIGPIDQFWENDPYFANSDAVRRKLALVNRESVKIDRVNTCLIKKPGLLKDDTTLVVLRRKH